MGLALITTRLGWDLLPVLILLLGYPTLFVCTFTGPAGGRPLGLLGVAGLIGAAALFSLDIRAIGEPGLMQQEFFRLIFHTALWGLFCLLGISPLPAMASHHHIQFRFQIAAPILLVIIWLGSTGVVPVVLFFFFSLTALSQARWVDSVRGGIGTIRSLKFGHRLLGPVSIFMPAGILLLAFSPDLARRLLGFLLGSGAALLGWLDRHLPPTRTGKPIDILLFSGCRMKTPKAESAFSKMDPLAGGGGIPGDPILLWISGIATLLIAAAFIRFALKGLKKKSPADTGQGIIFEADRVESSLLSRLTAWLAGIGHILVRFSRWMRRVTVLRFHRRCAPRLAMCTARELYRALLHWTAAHGTARLPNQTPLEYLNSLRLTYPQQDRELTLITEVYVRARYGRIIPSPAQFEEALGAWARVQAAAQKPMRPAVGSGRRRRGRLF